MMAAVKKAAPVFETQFAPHRRVFKNVGSSKRTLYTSRVEENGVVSLIPSGEEDIYAAIQSHKDSCDIHVLLARYGNGDVEALSRVQGVYGDFTEMPKTYAELLNTVIKGENYFNSLPVDVRAKFDHSLEKFMVSMDNMPDFMSKLGVNVNEVPKAENRPAESVSELAGENTPA